MRSTGRAHRSAAIVLIVSALVAAALVSAGPAAAQVRGFDGTTIKVAGYGILGSLPGAPVGAQARIQQFNDDKEIPGVKIDFAEFADDKQDPATSLSEVRRLITQEQVFALVPDVSLSSPADYITQQKVPTFGGGFSAGYCSLKPTTKEWLFGYQGCQVTTQPSVTADSEAPQLQYIRKTTGKQKPTVAEISNDSPIGQTVNKLFKIQYAKGGWGKVGYAEASIPPPPVGDLTPYVQKLLTAVDGHAPDYIRCGGSTECLTIYTMLRAAGYTGEFVHNLYTDALVKPFNGSMVGIPYHNLDATGNPALDKMKAAVAKVKPDQKIDTGVIYAYLMTDMFISALKKAANGKKANITPENVQKAAATQTWEIPGLAGPIKFPASTVSPTPLCRELVRSDGTTWQTVVPYHCSNTVYQVK
jgi:ABC-type branched-subunit amino acid transport system substrate-binding protein